MDAWEWAVLKTLTDIEICQMAVFTDFIPLQFCRFLTDFFRLNVNLVNFSISNTSVLFFILFRWTVNFWDFRLVLRCCCRCIVPVSLQ